MRAAAAAAVLAAAPVMWAGPVAPVLAAGYAVAGVVVSRGARRRKRAERFTDRAYRGVELLAADVRAGLSPPAEMAALAASIELDGEPATRGIARRLRGIARVVETTGAPAAELLDRLAVELRSAAAARAALAAHTAGTRATVVLLALLPLAGPLLGALVGADTLTLLFTTPVGAACLSAAAALQVVGLWWSHRIHLAVTRDEAVAA
ncbi:tight adherence protein B [Stackebrandtia albiflava]|uniref:Tight adherence protein B n=1 Tax=Stackebrandtia albiflava TaxID=406432 RepID=A0A562UYQ7_9ACTN|nr:hypothetical protein [Stackebrandtia albiflava]TWJ10774.1 tight adherence protein B [Stackebrandtia albiflava]